MVNGQQTRRSTARILRGVLLFVFAAATILPFCTSFFLCAMPCCHGGASPSAGMTAPMPACPGSPSGGCATEISAAVERTASTAPAPGPSQVKLSIAAATTLVPQVAAVRLPDDAPPPAAAAPLHVLNSVFRI